MGGYGSGRPGWGPLAEQSRALRIGRYAPLLQKIEDPRVTRASAVCRWTATPGGYEIASVLLIAERGSWGPRIRLRYSANGEPIEELIEVVTTQPNYGGSAAGGCVRAATGA